MPADLTSSLKKMSNWAFGSDVLNSLLGSTLVLAIIISLIMVLLIMIMYPAKRGTPFFIVVKMFLYMFGISLLVIFLHDSVLEYRKEEKTFADESENLIDGSTLTAQSNNPVLGGTYTPITPSYNDLQTIGGTSSGTLPINITIQQPLPQVTSIQQQSIPQPAPKKVESVINGGSTETLGKRQPRVIRQNPYKT